MPNPNPKKARMVEPKINNPVNGIPLDLVIIGSFET
jgi:hypothetical protein